MPVCRLCLVWMLSLALLAMGQSRQPSTAAIESTLRANHIAEALHLLGAAIQASPNNADLWTLQGIALSMKRDSPGASSAFQHALRLAPNNLAALRGEVQILNERHDRGAIPLLHRILTLAPGDTTAREMLALDEQRAGSCGAAIADFRQSGRAVERHPASLAAYGSCLNSTGHVQQSIAVFQQLAEQFPQLTFARYDLALVLYNTRKYKEALEVLEPVVQTGKGDAEMLSLASETYEAVGKTPQAVAMLRQAIVKKPTDVNLYNSFAKLCLGHKSYQAGISMVTAGIHYNPKAASLYLSRGLLFVELSQFSKAQSDFAAAERLDPGQGVSSYAMDMAELEQYHFDPGHSASAITALEAQLPSYPDNFLLHYLLAKLLIMQGPATGSPELEKAQSEAATAARLKPDFVAARDLLARIDLDSNDFTAAANESRTALRYDPDDRSALYHLVFALRHSQSPNDKAELKKMAERLGAIERDSLHNDSHKEQFRIVEAPPPPAEK